MEFSLFSTPPSGRRGQAVQKQSRDVWRRSGVVVALALLSVFGNPVRALGAATVSVTDVRHWSLGDVTRVAVQTTGEFRFKSQKLSNPDRIYFDIFDSRQAVSKTVEYSIPVDDGLVQKIRLAQNRRTVTRIVLDLGADVEVEASQLSNPDRLIIEVRRPQSTPSVSKTESLPKPGQTAQAGTSAKTAVAEKKPEPPRAPVKTKAPAKVATAEKKSAPPRQTAQAETSAKPAAAETKPKPAPQTAEKASPPVEPNAPPLIKLPVPKPRMAKAEPKMVEKPAASSRPSVAETEKKTEPAVTAAATPTPEPEKDQPQLIARPAKSNQAGGHSLTRVLGLKLGRIVIDPGHGGRDTGTIGPTGLREKEVTLDVSRRLAKLIESRMGSEVILTRDRDSSLKLRERTDKANSAQADLFVSVHVNSSRYSSVNGVETFYLNFTRSRADLEVAARENVGSDMPIHELSSLVQRIALDDKIQESRDLAATVQAAVYNVHRKHYSKSRDRGVKKAPFVVLIGAEMPSILVELGFISNPREEKLMKRDDYRQQLAESLYDGISKYAESLSRFQVAQVNDGDE